MIYEKHMSVIIQLNLTLIIFLLLFYPGQVFSFQEMEKFSASSTALDNHLHHSETVLLHYTEKNNSIREAEGSASLHIYNDGYAFVYYPPYMRRAGKYGIYLDQSDMERLWALLSSKHILEFNKETVRQRLYAEDQTQDELSRKLSNVANASITLIEIYPNRYKSADFGDGSREAMKKISWHGLKWDASKYQDIPEIQDLVVIQQKLLAIMQRPDLQKIE
jgi:hypothetical protein